MSMGQWQEAIAQAAQKYNVDPKLVASIIQVESGGKADAYNSEFGATGLGQQIPDTARRLGVNPKDPYSSIEGVAKLLDENLRRYGNPQQAVLAYHGGTDQDAWGPKTQDYLAKVSATYGAPQPMAQPAKQDFSGLKQPTGAQARGAESIPDFFTEQFGAPADGLKPIPETVPDYFSEQFGSSAMQPEPAAAAVPAPAAAPAPTATQDQGLSSKLPQMAWEGLQSLGAQGVQNANAIGQGISESFDAPAEWAAYGAEKSGLTGLLGKVGINMPTGDEQVAINAASRTAFDARNPDSGIQGAISRAGGNMAGVMLPLAGAQTAAVKGAGALSKAVGAAPETVAKIGAALQGQGGLLSRMGYGAAQGAGAGALLSGGQPNLSTGDAALSGAVFGAAVPVAASVLGYGKDLAGAVVAPFTAAGRERIAQQTLQQQAARAESPAVGTVAAPVAAPVPAAGGTAESAMVRAGAGGRTAGDFTEYVPGSVPTLAQATGNGGVAALERAAKGRAPNEFTERELSNYAARNQFLEGINGTPETLSAAVAAREAATAPLREASLAGARPANTNPVLATIDDILSSPEGQRKSVTNALKEVRSKLDLGENGAQSDVAQLYGVRKSINDQLEMVAGRDNSSAQQASSQLIQVREALDDAMEKAAPGFANYRQTYAEMSKPINSQEYLQGLNLTDQTSQRITLNSVKSALSKIEKLRNAPGSNNAKSISDEQLAALQNLHKDLQREANSSRGMALGSNTFQNLATNQLIDSIAPGKVGAAIGGLSPAGAGGALGYALGGPMGSGIGAAIGQQAGGMASRAMNAQGPEIEAKLINYLLNSRNAEVLAPKASGENAELLRILTRGAGAAPRPTSDQK